MNNENLTVHFKVKDFSAWRRSYDGHEKDRTSAGITSLLEELTVFATQPRFVYQHRWRVGDLVMWDNRCVMHRRDAFDESLRRLMHRTQIVGEPVLAG